MRRYDSLDSIRGLAALAVVFSHSLIALPVFYAALGGQGSQNFLIDLLAFSPFHLFWTGHEAVILFFILSGFVLSLPYLNNRKLVYKNYLIQRFFRIYIPYIVIIMISIFLQTLLYSPGGIAGMSKWFNWMWMLPVDTNLFAHFLFMTGELTHNYNTAAWSLVHEMRISLIFPFLVLLIKRSSVVHDLALIAAVFMIRYAVPGDLAYKLSDTLYYALFFVIGAVLAKYREQLGLMFRKTNLAFKLALFAVALLLYNWHWNFGLILDEASPYRSYFQDKAIGDLSIAAGACLFFMFAIHSSFAEKLLTHKVPLFLGKISYSLYLVHPVVLLTLFYALHNQVNTFVLLAMVPVVSIALAALYYRWVELPSMKMGKLLLSKPPVKAPLSVEAANTK